MFVMEEYEHARARGASMLAEVVGYGSTCEAFHRVRLKECGEEPARAMGMEKESGTIEAGKRADVILVDGNPLESISDIRKVSAVFTGGRMYQPSALRTSVGFKP